MLLFILPFISLPVFGGADARGGPEALGEVAGGGKAAHAGDLGQGVVGGTQQLLALPDAQLLDIVEGGQAKFLAEGMGQVEFVHVYALGQKVQGQGLPVVVFDISAHRHGIRAQVLPGGGEHLGIIGKEGHTRTFPREGAGRPPRGEYNPCG